ncbi:MAG: hypothetical protein IKZ97_04915, partial [Butyrivibrio sp.]|nr:hypothetical protein [Butyrivibrio sp.]
DDVAITKVQVYGEHGRVIDTIRCGESIIDAGIKVRERQKYYFLKLTRADDQIAVTAPIWIKQNS